MDFKIKTVTKTGTLVFSPQDDTWDDNTEEELMELFKESFPNLTLVNDDSLWFQFKIVDEGCSRPEYMMAACQELVSIAESKFNLKLDTVF
ncbi:hypothetical protein [Salmonella phage SSBI34]|nr:hypothetical protein [Salmonella phage SSBI34]